MSSSGLTEAKLRLGLWLDGPFVSIYVKDFITWSRSNAKLDLACVIIPNAIFHKGSASPRRGTVSQASVTKPAGSRLSTFLFGCLIALERVLLLKNRTHRHHLRKIDIHSLVPPEIIHQWHGGTTSEKLGQPDLLVSFTPALPDKTITDALKLGIIAVSPSDGRFGPPGFWEVYFRKDVTGFTIEHLRPGQDTPSTLLRGCVSTQFYYLLNQASLYQKAHYYLAKLIDRFAVTGAIPSAQENLPYSFRPLGIPASYQTLSYLGGFAALLFSKLLQKCGGDYRWKVGFLHSDWRDATLWQAALIENPTGHYLADPFVITHNKRNFCFVEDYDISARRGKISIYELGVNKATCLGVALQEDFHLSYPYIFHYAGQLYMCPETSEAKEIRIYRCMEFPLRWKLERSIMKNVSAVDSMLFERNGRWWMLTNIDPAHWGDHSLELCLFSAKTPLDEDWFPHPGNPFFIDASRSRNGGTVKDGNRLFRVAQGQGFGMYGKRTTINEIIKLNDTYYAEQAVCVVSATFRKGISGTHHLHSNGTMTVFDFV